MEQKNSLLKEVLSTPRDESFVMLIAGRRGSGKTTLLAKLLCSPAAWKGKYDKIVVISPTFNLTPQFKCFDTEDWDIHLKYDGNIIKELLESQSANWRVNERPRVLLVLDDLGKSSRKVKANETDYLEVLACNGRHVDISVVFLGQQLNQMNGALRSNADFILFFASHSLRDNLLLFNDVGKGEYKRFRDRVEELTKQRYCFFCVKNSGGRLVYHENFTVVEM
jgi:energy-coupling factor transporter ATP-binding protein EcfA2